MKEKRNLLAGVGLIGAFALWTVLIQWIILSLNRHRLVTGMVLSISCAAVFILTRQPYAGIVCLAILVVKGLLIGKGKSLL